MNYLTLLQEHLRLFWYLRTCTKILDARFVRRYLRLFWEGAAVNLRMRIKLGLLFGALLDTVSPAHAEKEHSLNNFSAHHI
jgi:hypothetical protein